MPAIRVALTRLLGTISVVLLFTSSVISFRSGQPALAQSERATTLSALLLSPADIKGAYGPGFKVVLAQTTTNSQLRKTLGSAGATSLQGLAGRVTGYESMYTHQLIAVSGKKVTAKPGVSLVLSGVNQYQSSAYAHRAMSVTQQSNTKAKLPAGTTQHAAPLSGVGDAAVILSVHTGVKGFPTSDSVYIAFQRGKYTAIVDVSAYGGKPDARKVLALAHLMDARIRAKG